MMQVRNAIQKYRPLRAGIRIFQGAMDKPGTIGLFGKSADGRFWLVSCYHVLIRPPGWNGAPPQDGEAIYQPEIKPANKIAAVDPSRANKTLDCAAALLEPGIDAVPEILGLGSIGSAALPAVGMRVTKSGSATGVTEGMIRRIQGDTVRIEPLQGFPADYELSQQGDSGALWIEQSTGAAVALHRRGETGQGEFAEATAIGPVLTALGLTLWTGT
ncbi:MAG: hypothetical protein IT364_26810 [Candidatus Hydrogenedentes bacterium]|nr:hypothetical protein [Candidatus Hydrogenedentota bacterium]